MNDAIVPKKHCLDFQADAIDSYTAGADKHFAAPKSSRADYPDLQQSDVLVIDNLKQSQNLLGFLLKKRGYRYDLADAANMAIARVSSRNYKFIFLALDLADADPGQLSSTLKLIINKLAHDSKIIGVSFEQPNEPVCSGMDAYVRKSSLGEDLERVIQQFEHAGEFASEDSGLGLDSNITGSAAVMREYDMQFLVGTVRTILPSIHVAVDEQDKERLLFLLECLQSSLSRFHLEELNFAVNQMAEKAKASNWHATLQAMNELDNQAQPYVK